MDKIELKDSKLLADRLLIVPERIEMQLSQGGILLPNDGESMDKADVGKVLSVSERVLENDHECDKVAVGDRILYSKYAGTKTVFGGIEYRVLRITDIILVLPEDLGIVVKLKEAEAATELSASTN